MLHVDRCNSQPHGYLLPAFFLEECLVPLYAALSWSPMGIIECLGFWVRCLLSYWSRMELRTHETGMSLLVRMNAASRGPLQTPSGQCPQLHRVCWVSCLLQLHHTCLCCSVGDDCSELCNGWVRVHIRILHGRAGGRSIHPGQLSGHKS